MYYYFVISGAYARCVRTRRSVYNINRELFNNSAHQNTIAFLNLMIKIIKAHMRYTSNVT